MSNNYTYSLVPEANKDAICGHYCNSNGEFKQPPVDGYYVIDCGKSCDMATEHAQIKQVCDAHSYDADLIDVLKSPEAHKIADPLAHADAQVAVPAQEDMTPEEYATYRANYDAAYKSAYDNTHYPAAFASITTIDCSQLSHDQAKAYIAAYAPAVEI